MLIISIGGKRKNYIDFDDMIKKIGLDEISEGQREYISKRSRRGEVTYIARDPYDSEINDKRSIIVGETQEEVNEAALNRAEDI